jgi:hypothetical protein
MNSQALLTALQNELSLELYDRLNEKELQLRVQEKVNELIVHDFGKLVNILYRIDVSEQKLKQVLQSNDNKDAAAIIAGLIIERQIEKIKSRRDTKHFDNTDDTEEKW